MVLSGKSEIFQRWADIAVLIKNGRCGLKSKRELVTQVNDDDIDVLFSPQGLLISFLRLGTVITRL